LRYTAQKQSVNYYRDQNYRPVIAVRLVTSERFAHSKIHHLIIMRYNRAVTLAIMPARRVDSCVSLRFASICRSTDSRVNFQTRGREAKGRSGRVGCPSSSRISRISESLSSIPSDRSAGFIRRFCRFPADVRETANSIPVIRLEVAFRRLVRRFRTRGSIDGGVSIFLDAPVTLGGYRRDILRGSRHCSRRLGFPPPLPS